MFKEEQLLYESCKDCLTEHVKAGQTVLAAISGGVDSMVMLDLLLALREMFGIQVEVGHIHHHLRQASDAEWKFVEAYCVARDVRFHGRHIDVRAAQAERGSSMEAEAHRLRHAALREIMDACDATWLCLAHHAGDRAETVLMNLLRGSSIKGLAAMGAQNGVILRPLLGVTRSDIECYARKKEIPWVNDESNNDTTILRNRLRHELLPILGQYNPAIVQALNHLADSSEVASDYIEQQAQALYQQAMVLKAKRFCMLKRTTVTESHPAVISALLRQLVEMMSIGRHSLHFDMVNHALERIEVGNGRYDLGKGLIIEVTRRWIYIGMIPTGEWQRVDNGYVHDFLEAQLTIEENAPFAVRFPQVGDDIQLANLGHKRLKKIFQEEGLPSCLRAVWPIVYDIKTKEVIWAPFLARASLLMYYNSVTFSEVDLTITIAGQTEQLSIKTGN